MFTYFKLKQNWKFNILANLVSLNCRLNASKRSVLFQIHYFLKWITSRILVQLLHTIILPTIKCFDEKSIVFWIVAANKWNKIFYNLSEIWKNLTFISLTSLSEILRMKNDVWTISQIHFDYPSSTHRWIIKVGVGFNSFFSNKNTLLSLSLSLTI